MPLRRALNICGWQHWPTTTYNKRIYHIYQPNPSTVATFKKGAYNREIAKLFFDYHHLQTTVLIVTESQAHRFQLSADCVYLHKE